SLRIFFEQRIAATKGYRGGSGGWVEMKAYHLYLYAF
nr:hypothetical protein [Tanacetum cinerariifolium]